MGSPGFFLKFLQGSSIFPSTDFKYQTRKQIITISKESKVMATFIARLSGKWRKDTITTIILRPHWMFSFHVNYCWMFKGFQFNINSYTGSVKSIGTHCLICNGPKRKETHVTFLGNQCIHFSDNHIFALSPKWDFWGLAWEFKFKDPFCDILL